MQEETRAGQKVLFSWYRTFLSALLGGFFLLLSAVGETATVGSVENLPERVHFLISLAEKGCAWLQVYPLIRISLDHERPSAKYIDGSKDTLLWYVSAIAVLILLGLMAWNLKLLREIKLRKEAESVLSNNERKFRLVFESANVGKSIMLPTGDMEVNQAFSDMLGYSREELRNKTWREITPPDDMETSEKMLKPLLEGEKESTRFIIRYVHKNGFCVWADVSVAVNRDTKGNPLYFIITIVDITERKRTEVALDESKERLWSTLDNLIEGGQIIGFDWRYLYVNNSLVRQGRVTKEALLGKTMMEVFPDIEKTEVFARLKECMEERLQRRMENEFVFPDGSRGWFRLNIQPVPEGIFVLSEDITDQRISENALRSARERIQVLIDANIVGIVIAKPSGEIIEANDYYLSIIGYTRKELEQGMINWRAITPPEWFSADERAIKELLEKNTCATYEKEYIRRDGTRVSVILSDTMLPGGEEQIAAFVLDITERKRTEEKIKGQLNELQRWHDVMLEREDRVQELKREINVLCRRLGENVRYPSQEDITGSLGQKESKL